MSSAANRIDYTNIPLPTPPTGPAQRKGSEPAKESTADKIRRVAQRQRRESTPHPSKFAKDQPVGKK